MNRYLEKLAGKLDKIRSVAGPLLSGQTIRGIKIKPMTGRSPDAHHWENANPGKKAPRMKADELVNWHKNQVEGIKELKYSKTREPQILKEHQKQHTQELANFILSHKRGK